ncbi:hypothetical protein F2Q70_00012500 [Brassica cretica]|uniref:Uncharacterized protein n=1 Tax=Brassica cretica TaxID=69181 RepID=A0A8S9LXG0_BRACR|nr:hypothetical protein F2Q70_00012500 [Brassica cretica]
MRMGEDGRAMISTTHNVVDEATPVEETVHPDHEGGNQPNMQVIHEEAVHEEVIHDSAVHGEVIHEKAIYSSAVHDQDGMQ